MRLTEKHTDYFEHYHIKPDVGEDAIAQKWNYYDAVEKLGKLEDIEEALGVDLILYLKMCVIEASVFILNKIINEVYEFRCPQCVYNPYLKAFGFKAIKDTYNWRFPMSEYGKTWALSKDELNK